MTKTEDKPDCLELKRQMQEKVLKYREGLTPQEQIKKDEELILKDPKFGPLWRRLAERKKRQTA